MPENRAAVCPFCGNDRVIDRTVDVKPLGGGQPDRRSFCAGSLGCHASWNPATLAPVAPLPVRS